MKFKKKPIEVEALQYLREENIFAAQDFCPALTYDPAENEYYILTLEGKMHIAHGDWIIKDIAGEFYPCKPDIFKETYEPLQD